MDDWDGEDDGLDTDSDKEKVSLTAVCALMQAVARNRRMSYSADLDLYFRAAREV